MAFRSNGLSLGTEARPRVHDSATDLPDEALALIKAELQPDEKLLWAEETRPRGQSRRAGWITAFLWAAGCGIVSAVCLTPLIPVPRDGWLDGATAITGLLAGVIGFFIVVGMLTSWLSNLGESRIGPRYLYALTDRRAIIRRRQPGSRAVEVFTVSPDQVKVIHRIEFPDGTGDVMLGWGASDFASPWSFQNIREVRRIEDLTRQVLLAPDRTRSPLSSS